MILAAVWLWVEVIGFCVLINHFVLVFQVRTVRWVFQIPSDILEIHDFSIALNCKFKVIFSKQFIIIFLSFFSETDPLMFLKIVNPSSRYRARLFLLYFSDNLWSRKLPTSLRISAPSKASFATSKIQLAFFIDDLLLLNRSDFWACLIIALSSVRMSMYSSVNFKALSNRVSLVEL